MIDRAGHVTARLKSEYRGVLVYDKHVWEDFGLICEFDPAALSQLISTGNSTG